MGEIITHLLALVGGVAGGYFIGVRVTISRLQDESATVSKQEGNIVKGDQAGRDIRK